ncbi:cytochrome c oxidase assembly protein subunit 15 [Tamaricihabitans halophyticus]|uniref:Cytochrome c oxidase assembly protein subunit 15 n=1 Tax=Tamaricihabitans halophyticus TaxID=1262583 RepID=A0A4V2SSA9_9PSEU|nr:COX15/CtaA family protein [Tamaricihabitans halophyticus]TCP46216.1 cytochrome c oxidase assembly protein subunit 15 [Tamaricihabitans halophyticus]
MRVRKAVAIFAIVTNAGIGVTGSVVRVTGSGLGCPNWPQCISGRMFPVAHPEYAMLNQWIEFGNRLLTGIVGIAAALCVIVALRLRPRRKRLILLAWAMPLGVVVQAGIGGIVVLTGLIWWTVAVHFLASTALTWAAVLLLHAFTEGDEPPKPVARGRIRAPLWTVVAALGAVQVAGTLVTGAGPHAGDPETPRLQLPVEVLAHVHSALLYFFLAVLLLLGWLARGGGAPASFWRRYGILWLAVLAQGTIGMVQFLLGVPEMLVSLHVLGAACTTIAAAALWCASRERGALPQDAPFPARPEPALATERTP